MADLFYIEDGYIDASYYGYLADAVVDLRGYIESGYLDPDYYTYYGAVGTLTCSATVTHGVTVEAYGTWFSAATLTAAIGSIKPASISLSSAFTQTVTTSRTRIVASSLSSAASISATAIRARIVASSLSSAATISTTALRTRTVVSSQSSAATVSISIGVVKTGTSALASAFTRYFTAVKTVSGVATFNGVFNPVLTVGIVKNSFALFNASASLATVSVKTARSSITLQTIASLNAQNARTRRYDSSLSSMATQSASAVKTTNITATLNSTATLTVIIGSVKVNSVALTIRATLTTRKYFGSFRPRDLNRTQPNQQSLLYDTSIKKFGAASFYGITNSYNYADALEPVAAGYDLMLIPSKTESFIWEFWFYSPTAGSSSVVNVGGFQIIISRQADVTLRSVRIRLTYTYSGGTSYYDFGGDRTGLTRNAWHHVAVIKNSSYLSAYVDGTRLYGYSASSFPNINNNSQPWEGYHDLAIVSLGSDQQTRIDELNFQVGTTLGYDPSQTTITLPTEARTNDTATTRFLYHFDNNVLDDLVATEIASATLASAVTITTTAIKSIRTTATLASAATISTTASRTQTASAILASAAAITTVGKVTKEFANISLASAATITASIGVIRQGVSVENTAFSSSFRCVARLAGVASLYSIATINTVIDNRTRTQSSSMSTSASISITASRTRTVNSTLNTAASMVVNVGKLIDFASALATAAALTATTYRVKQADISLSAQATQTASADRTRGINSALSSSATITATAYRIKQAASALNTQATQSVSAVKTTSAQAAFASSASAVITVTRTRNTSASLQFITSELTVAVKNATGTITLEARFTQSATAVKTARLTKTLSSSAAITLLGGKLIEYPSVHNTGVEVYSVDKYPRVTITTSNPGYAPHTGNFTASIWARRNSITGTVSVGYNVNDFNYQPLWSDSLSSFAFSLHTNDVVLRYNYDPDEPGAHWADVAPVDSGWHHYLLYAIPNGVNPSNTWRLWVDGVDQGTASRGAYLTGGLSNGAQLRLGQGRIAKEYVSDYASSEFYLDGSVAQIWMGTGSGAPTVSNFYNKGYVDLGANGRGAGNVLPAPEVYNTLSAPFTGVDFNTNQYTPGEEYATVGINTTTGVFKMATTPVFVFLFVGHLNSAAAITISTTIRNNATARLNTTATLACTSTTYVGIIGYLVSAAALTNTITRQRAYSATLTAFASELVVIGKRQNETATLSSQFTLTCDVSVKPPVRFSAALMSAATVTATVFRVGITSVALTSAATITATARRIKPLASALNSTASLTCNASVKLPIRITASLNTFATQTSTVRRFRATSTQLNSTATLVISTKKIVGMTISLQAFVAEITVGDIINIDPFLTLTIAPETRIITILPESRDLVIEQETRMFIIEGI